MIVYSQSLIWSIFMVEFTKPETVILARCLLFVVRFSNIVHNCYPSANAKKKRHNKNKLQAIILNSTDVKPRETWNTQTQIDTQIRLCNNSHNTTHTMRLSPNMSTLKANKLSFFLYIFIVADGKWIRTQFVPHTTKVRIMRRKVTRNISIWNLVIFRVCFAPIGLVFSLSEDSFV